MIIGFAGQKQSGKSTAADYIEATAVGPVVQHSFADNLKEFCIKTLGLTRKQCGYDGGTDDDKNSFTEYKWDNVNEFFRRKYGKIIDLEDLQGPTKELRTGPMTAREVMQVQGEMQRRMFYRNLWVDAIFREIDDYGEGVIHVITDIRHQNEVEKTIDADGYVIHLMKQTNNDAADSEKELMMIDWGKYPRVYAIDNSVLTIEEKNDRIKELLQKIIGVDLYTQKGDAG